MYGIFADKWRIGWLRLSAQGVIENDKTNPLYESKKKQGCCKVTLHSMAVKEFSVFLSEISFEHYCVA